MRWVFAVIVGFFAYWAALLLSLGIISLSISRYVLAADHQTYDASVYVGHSIVLVGLAVFLGVFAGCISSMAIAPRAGWRIMGYIAAAVGVLWTVYGQISHPLIGAAATDVFAILGAGAAYVVAAGSFGRQAPAPLDLSPTP
jgi:hypothetical protein